MPKRLFRYHKVLTNPSVGILLLCLWGLYRRFHLRAIHELWVDEVWQIQGMDQPFWEYIKILPKREFAAYLSGDFYMTYVFYRIFGANKWGLAIPHIIVTILGFYVMYLLCQRYLKTAYGYAIVFIIICFNYELTFHAFEIRTYAVLPVLAITSLYFLHRLFAEGEIINQRQKVLMQIFFIITIWWHLYGVLIVFFPLLYFFVTAIKDKEFGVLFKRISRFFIPVFIIAMPLWLISVFGKNLSIDPLNAFEYIANPLKDMIAFLKSIFGNLVGDRRLYFLLLGPVLSILLPHPCRYKQTGFFISLVLLPIALLLALAVYRNYWFLQRHFVWCIPYFALYVGWCWESSFEYLHKRIKKGLASNKTITPPSH